MEYTKANRSRSYNLRVGNDDRTELWVTTRSNGIVERTRRLVTFDDPAEVPLFLREVERELRRGGWSQTA